MPASYVHQRVAAHVCQSLALFDDSSRLHALAAGSEGPDPFFFSLFSLPGTQSAPHVGSVLHTQRTDAFMLALIRACADHPLTRAFCCGFLTHYATDTTFHPFVYAHSLDAQGHYSGTLHCTLEHQLETRLYRSEGHETGLPRQMDGYAQLSHAEKNRIAQVLSSALDAVFPELSLGVPRVRRSFDDAVTLCQLLRSESGFKFRTLGALLHPLGLDAPLHAHMMPLDLPKDDIANESHQPWSSIWTPDQTSTGGFDELFTKAIARGQELVSAVHAFWDGTMTDEAFSALHGGFSYDSGLPWQDSCPASQAPGVQP